MEIPLSVTSCSKSLTKNIETKKLSYVTRMCFKCKIYAKDSKKMLKCISHHKYHIKCVPQSHRQNFDSDDESESFICMACFVFADNSFSDESTNNLFEECRKAYE